MNPDHVVMWTLIALCAITLAIWLPLAVRRELRREGRTEAMRRHPAGKHAPDAEYSTFVERNRR